MHAVSQYSQKPVTLTCPLCQDKFREWDVLENHVMDAHNAKKEYVNNVMVLVDKTEWLAAQASAAAFEEKHEVKVNNKEVHPASKVVDTNSPTLPVNTCIQMDLNTFNHNDLDHEDLVEVKEKMPEVDSRSDSSSDQSNDDDEEGFACDMCGRIFAQVEDLFCHQNEMGHLQFKATSKGNGYYCWRKGCELFFGAMAATQLHFKECHALRSNIPVSERHVYNYICTKCRLSFKTSDELTTHMQHHVMRAATKCVLCGRSFRTIHALQKHVEMAHCDMTKEEVEQYRASLMVNPLLSVGGAIGSCLDSMPGEMPIKETSEDLPDETISLPDDSDDIIEDGKEGIGKNEKQRVLKDYINVQDMAEDSSNDPNRKYKCHLCRVAFKRQIHLTRHYTTLMHLKGEEEMSYPMDKCLDPNRPFKCEARKESFTQKNILLDHCSSVSDTHELKLSVEETNSVETPPNQKAYIPAQPDPTNISTSERPDSAPPSKSHEGKPTEFQITSSSEAPCISTSATTAPRASKPAQDSRSFPFATNSAISSSTITTIPPLNSSQFPFPLHPDHINIMQQAQGLLPPTSLLRNQALPYHCNRCGTICSSADALIQHQQLYCIFALSQYPSPPMLNLQANNSQNSTIPLLSHLQVQKQQVDKFSSNVASSAASDFFSMGEALSSAAASCMPTFSSLTSLDLRTSLSKSFPSNPNPFVCNSSMMPLMPPTSASSPTSESPHSTGTPSGTPTPSCSSGKRANRTRFTDYQIKVLQEFFETNAYPKDDDLESLSKLLNLSCRVITVWFQNAHKKVRWKARQKAGKVYEKENEEENAGTPAPSYFSGKRAKRTRKTHYQTQVLREFFESNAYPRVDDIKYLSNLSNLSDKVIVDWFQNARRKARQEAGKVYEKENEEENAGPFQQTPGLNYQCKKSLQVFQRHNEQIKHQESSCFKDQNTLAGTIEVMSGEEKSSQPPTSTLSTPTPPTTPVVSRANPEQQMVVSSNSNQNGAYRCDKCSLSFGRFDLWREHQSVHMMNSTLFPNFLPRPRLPPP